MESLNFSRAEMRQLEELADALGVSVQAAVEAAAKQGLELMFRLPDNPDSEVVPLEGLKRACESTPERGNP